MDKIYSIEEVNEAKRRVRVLSRKFSSIQAIGQSWDDNGHPCLMVNLSFDVSQSEIDDIAQSLKAQLSCYEKLPCRFEKVRSTSLL